MTVRERQEGFTPDTNQKVLQLRQKYSFYVTLFPIKVALEMFGRFSVFAGRSQVM